MNTLGPILAMVLLGACRGVPSRTFPLVEGAGCAAAVQRVDIDWHVSGPPPVTFDVDCTSLPYAKGSEREFCYSNGYWAIVNLPTGLIVACNCGEFGGFVLWYSRAGELQQTLLAGDIPKSFLCDGESLVCITGISHLDISEGAVHGFRLQGDRWQHVATSRLPSEADRVQLEPDGGLLLGLHRDEGAYRYRAGHLEAVARGASAAPRATFAGSSHNGDKAGIGLELTFVGEQVESGMFSVIAPNGSERVDYPIEIVERHSEGFTFRVDLRTSKPSKFVARLSRNSNGTMSVRLADAGTGVDEQRPAIVLKFVH